MPLRILRKHISLEKFHNERSDHNEKFGLEPEPIKGADERLRNYKPWEEYLNSIQKEQKQEEGNFFLAKLFQDEAARTASNETSSNITETRSMMRNQNPNQNRQHPLPKKTPTKGL